jgi:predicted nucleic acid-binding protein
MNANRGFLDSNIVIYAYSMDEAFKCMKARAVIAWVECYVR